MQKQIEIGQCQIHQTARPDRLECQGHAGVAIAGLFALNMLKRQRRQGYRRQGSEHAFSAVLSHRGRSHLATGIQHLAALSPRCKVTHHHGTTGIATQLPGRQLFQQLFTDVAFAVINPAANLRRNKRDPFQQALHIGITVLHFGQVEHSCLFGVGTGKIHCGFVEQPHFRFKILPHWFLLPSGFLHRHHS